MPPEYNYIGMGGGGGPGCDYDIFLGALSSHSISSGGGVCVWGGRGGETECTEEKRFHRLSPNM